MISGEATKIKVYKSY